MISIILAGVLGAITIVTVVLLFRRLRADLDRQLAAISAERDSEWIMRGIGRAPNTATQQPGSDGPPAVAANGEDLNPPPPLPGLIRSKRNLHLLRGGAVTALVLGLAEWAHDALTERRSRFAGALVGVAAGATTVTLLTVTPWTDGADHRPPSLAPTAAPTVTVTQPPSAPPNPPQPTPGESGPDRTAPASATTSPSASATPNESVSPSPGPTTSVVPVGEESTAAPGAMEPSPGGGTTSPGGPGTQEPPSASPEEPPAAASPPPSPTPAESGLCIGPVLDIELCLPPLGGG